MAKSSSRQQLADACRQRRQDGVHRDELAAAQRAKRSFRSWVDGDGMQCGQFRLEPLTGLPLLARIQAEADRLHRRARQGGSTEPWEAHAADALASFLDAGSGGEPGERASASAPVPATGAASGGDASSRAPGKRAKPRKAEVVLVVDLQSYRTGEHAGTRCHLLGGGPVPVEVVREMAKDAFLKVVFHDGVNIHTVTHLGRYIPAELRTALELGNSPDFAGVACSGCGKKFRLQWDHVEPLCVGGVTSFANEDAKCWDCHARKSDAERAAGLYDRSHRAFPADGGRPSDPP